jgi:hypothetical protein
MKLCMEGHPRFLVNMDPQVLLRPRSPKPGDLRRPRLVAHHVCAGEDTRTTAGLETGATIRRRYDFAEAWTAAGWFRSRKWWKPSRIAIKAAWFMSLETPAVTHG